LWKDADEVAKATRQQRQRRTKEATHKSRVMHSKVTAKSCQRQRRQRRQRRSQKQKRNRKDKLSRSLAQGGGNGRGEGGEGSKGLKVAKKAKRAEKPKDAKEAQAPAVVSCIDPALDDPERFSCECLAQGLQRCHGQNIEECMRKILCTSESLDVCQEWKDSESGHCDEQALDIDDSSAEMIQRNQSTSAKMVQKASALIARRSKTETNMGDSLDSSVQGKCSQ